MVAGSMSIAIVASMSAGTFLYVLRVSYLRVGLDSQGTLDLASDLSKCMLLSQVDIDSVFLSIFHR